MRTRRSYTVMLACASACMISACELQEVTTADAEDVVIVEMVLRGGDTLQTAYLHRTDTPDHPPAVTGASVVVTEAATGTRTTLPQASDSLCLRSETPPRPVAGTCYGLKGPVTTIKPGTRYTLRIVLADGRVMTGTTDVPASFTITRPPTLAGQTRATCRLDVGKSFELIWTKSAGASVYLTESRLRNLRQALRATGVHVEGDSDVELSGLSVSANDTTMHFPGDLGLFDRFDEDLFELLLALRVGLPADVDGTIVIAAADRNYVNWVRGGNFNPSGQVHISSIRGDGAGVFGSIVSRTVLISTRASTRQPCISP